MLGFEAVGRLALGEVPPATATQLIAAQGTYTLTLQSVDSAVSMSAAAGALALTMQTVTGAVSLPAAQGSYALTGYDAGLPYQVFMAASPFLITERSQMMFAALGEVALGEYRASSRPTFQTHFPDIVASTSLPADQGSYTLTGRDAALFLGFTLDPITGVYTLNGQSAVFQINLPAAQGAYALTLVAVDMVRAVSKIRRFPRVGTSTATARSRGAGIRTRSYGG